MNVRPPRLARAIATWLLRGDAREVIVGDLDQEFAEAVTAGSPIGAARRRYWRQTLASIVATKQRAREIVDVKTSPKFQPLQGLALDLKSVLRVLRHSPGYVAVAVLSLAFGIGANSAVFSVVRQLLLQPLPVDRSDDLRIVYWTPNSDAPLHISNINSSGYRDPSSGTYYRSNFSYGEFTAMRAAVRETADLAGFNSAPGITIAADGRPPVSGTGFLVSGNFLATLRPPLAIGRAINDDDDSASAPPVAVIGYGLWTRLFGNDPAVLGRTIHVNSLPVTIVGVTAPSYRGLSPGGYAADVDVTLPIALQPAIMPKWADSGRSLLTGTDQYWVRLIARVHPGADRQVEDALRTTFRAVFMETGQTAEQAALAEPRLFPGARGTDSMRTAAVQPLRIMSVVVGIVLLIACINVAGLMLARGVSRQRELVVRRALGAGRARIMRQLLLESVILSVAGGIAGLLLALLVAPVLQSMLSTGLGTNGVSVTLDWTLIGLTAVLACAVGIVAGLLPALRFSGQGQSVLQNRSGGAGAPRLMIGRALIALQIAVSLPLVIGAGLFLRTLHNLGSLEIGFNPRGLVLFVVDPTMGGRAPERTATVYPLLLDRLEAIPGVTSATLVENALLSGWESDSTVTINDRQGHMYMNAVGPHYLETMEVPLLGGRSVTAADRKGTPNVVVVNRTAARQYFGDASPIGQRFKVGSREVEIVGVFADTKYDALRNDIPPTMLQPYLQRQMGSMHVIVRTDVPVATLRPAIERAVQDVDPSLPITGFTTQEEQIDQSIGKERVFARLLTTFGLFALLLACLGLHGVTSYSVARRTGEFGIRLALGAQRSQLLWLVLRQVVALAIIGLAIGLPVAWLAGPAVRSLLFGLEPNDARTILVSAIVMGAVAMLAGFWPARRAAKMEALSALRSE